MMARQGGGEVTTMLVEDITSLHLASYTNGRYRAYSRSLVRRPRSTSASTPTARSTAGPVIARVAVRSSTGPKAVVRPVISGSVVSAVAKGPALRVEDTVRVGITIGIPGLAQVSADWQRKTRR
jgi:hypothetical protein